MEKAKRYMKERRTGRKKIYPPIICTKTDEDEKKYIIDVTMPGVRKEDFSIRLNENGFFIEGESKKYKYLGGVDLFCDIDPEEASFSFKDGSFRIHAPFKALSEVAS